MRTGRDAPVDLLGPAQVGFSESLFLVKGLSVFSIPNGRLFQCSFPRTSARKQELKTSVQSQLVDPNADPETQKFHVLVAAIISSQTRDAVTAAAMKRLQALPGGLTVNRLADGVCPTEKMEELLKPVGFYRCSCPASSPSAIKFRVSFHLLLRLGCCLW